MIELVPRTLRSRLKKIGPNAYWRNGIIRNKELHPTKGWRDYRVELWPIANLRGQISQDEAQ